MNIKDVFKILGEEGISSKDFGKIKFNQSTQYGTKPNKKRGGIYFYIHLLMSL